MNVRIPCSPTDLWEKMINRNQQKIQNRKVVHNIKSLMLSVYRIGPTEDPWGTPESWFFCRSLERVKTNIDPLGNLDYLILFAKGKKESIH